MRAALLSLLPLLAGFAPLLSQTIPASADPSKVRPTFPVPLERGDFPVYDLPPPDGTPAKALVLLVSGGGGWTYWEDRVGRRLAKGGCYVLGIDAAAYTATDYTQETLAADFERIAAAAPPALAPDGIPVLYAGRGMGAGQAVAAAALAPNPPRLRGLLLLAPEARGRYGIRLTDRFYLSPRGKGTFALADLAPGLGPIRVAQLHADHHEWFSSLDWLDKVPGPHERIDFPQTWRTFGEAGKALTKAVDEGVAWLLEDAGTAAP